MGTKSSRQRTNNNNRKPVTIPEVSLPTQTSTSTTSSSKPVTIPELSLSNQMIINGNSCESETFYNCTPETFFGSFLSSQNSTSNLGDFALIPKEIFSAILSMIDRSDCWQLIALTSHSFRNLFTHIAVYISCNQEVDYNLIRSYYSSRSRFTFPNFFPRFLVLNNFGQLKKLKDYIPLINGLIVHCSERFALSELPEFPEFPLLHIKWYDYKPESGRDVVRVAISHIMARVFTVKKYPKVKELILDNLVCSSTLIKHFIATFGQLEYLKFASFNPNPELTFQAFELSLSGLTKLGECEIVLPTSNNFTLGLPEQLNKCTVNTLPSESSNGQNILQRINSDLCISLKSLIINKALSDNNSLEIIIPKFPCLETLMSVTGGHFAIVGSINCLRNLTTIHLSNDDTNPLFNILVTSVDGELTLRKELCPNCIDFRIFGKDKDNKSRLG